MLLHCYYNFVMNRQFGNDCSALVGRVESVQLDVENAADVALEFDNVDATRRGVVPQNIDVHAFCDPRLPWSRDPYLRGHDVSAEAELCGSRGGGGSDDAALAAAENN